MATNAIHPYFTTHLHLLIESEPNAGPGIDVDPGAAEHAQRRNVLSTPFFLAPRVDARAGRPIFMHCLR